MWDSCQQNPLLVLIQPPQRKDTDRKKTKFTCDLVSVGACPLQRHIINPSVDGGGGDGLLGPKPTEITHRLDLGLRSCWVDTHRLIRNSALFYFCLLL